MNTNPRMLIVVPYWDGDKEAALDTTQLAADLITKRADDTGILFVYRSDSSPPPSGFIQRMRDKFGRVDAWKCDRRGEGFPMGPNEMYFGIFSMMVNRKFNFSEFDFIFVMESDVVVTRPNWHLELIEEWKLTAEQGKFICGFLHPTGFEYPSHINASALYDRRVLQLLPQLTGCDGNIGWDYYFGSVIVPVARQSRLFTLDYSRATIDEATLLASSALVYHGVKDGSARRILAEKHRLGVPATPRCSVEEFAELNGYSVSKSLTETDTWILKKL